MTITGTIESIFLSYYLQVRTERVNVNLNHSWNLILLVSKQKNLSEVEFRLQAVSFILVDMLDI